MQAWIPSCWLRKRNRGAPPNNLVRCGLLLLAAARVSAHDPITTSLTWSKEIVRVVYTHCASCHRPDGRAFSLLTFEDARPWAKAIRDEVLNRRMPPWDAVKGVGEFRNDPTLSLPEIDLIVNWVEGGAPQGNPDYLPPKPRTDDPAPEPSGRSRKLTQTTTLSAPLTLTGIRPEGVTELAALLPDGSVRRLIWVHAFHPKWNRTYWLRSAMLLPTGTQLILNGAAAILYLPR